MARGGQSSCRLAQSPDILSLIPRRMVSQSVASTTPSLTISSSAKQIIPTVRDAKVGEESGGGVLTFNSSEEKCKTGQVDSS